VIEERVAAIILGGLHVWADGDFGRLCPRLLLPVGSAPLGVHILRWLRGGGVRAVTICANEAAEAVQECLGDGKPENVDLYYCVDRIPRGPAGCSCDAAASVPAEQYIVVEGSVVPRVDLRALLAAHERAHAAATVVVDGAERRGEGAGWGAAPAGIYVFSRRTLAQVPRTGYQDIKEMLIPQLYREHAPVVTYAAGQPSARVYDLASYLAVQGWILARCALGESVPDGYVQRDGLCIHGSAAVARTARLVGPVLVGPKTRVGAEAVIVGPTLVGADCAVGRRAVVARSVIWDQCVVASGAQIDQSLLTTGAAIEGNQTVCGAICEAPTPAGAAVRWFSRGGTALD
jgi:mannose-1-phosphate guanylyltransferase